MNMHATWRNTVKRLIIYLFSLNIFGLCNSLETFCNGSLLSHSMHSCWDSIQMFHWFTLFYFKWSSLFLLVFSSLFQKKKNCAKLIFQVSNFWKRQTTRTRSWYLIKQLVACLCVYVCMCVFSGLPQFLTHLYLEVIWPSLSEVSASHRVIHSAGFSRTFPRASHADRTMCDWLYGKPFVTLEGKAKKTDKRNSNDYKRPSAMAAAVNMTAMWTKREINKTTFFTWFEL